MARPPAPRPLLCAGAALATSDIEVESAEEARALAAQLVEAGGDAPYRVTYRTKKVSAESDGQVRRRGMAAIQGAGGPRRAAARRRRYTAAETVGRSCACACACSQRLNCPTCTLLSPLLPA